MGAPAPSSERLGGEGVADPVPARADHPRAEETADSSYIRFAAELLNQMWQTDFTHYPLADRQDVEILNFLDDRSRSVFSTARRSAGRCRCCC